MGYAPNSIFTPDWTSAPTAENSKCAHFIAEEDDALTMEWKEDFFANVPYSQVRRWIEYGLQQVDKHQVTGLFLTFAKTDSRFFHAVYERPNVEMLFHKGRIRFPVGRQTGQERGPVS